MEKEYIAGEPQRYEGAVKIYAQIYLQAPAE